MPDENENRDWLKNLEKGLPEEHYCLISFEQKDLDSYEKAIEGYENLYIDKEAYDPMGRKIPNYFRLVLAEPKKDMSDFWKKLKTIKKERHEAS